MHFEHSQAIWQQFPQLVPGLLLGPLLDLCSRLIQ